MRVRAGSDEGVPGAMRRRGDELLVGEWAALGVVCARPTHGFALAARLTPTGDLGRVWSMSRALAYRCVDQLLARGLIEVVGEQPGAAGGPRTMLGATADGCRRLNQWLGAPVPHLRDYRSELLLKILISRENGVDPRPMLSAQRTHTVTLALALDGADKTARTDPVAVWRRESVASALRFIDQTLESESAGRRP